MGGGWPGGKKGRGDSDSWRGFGIQEGKVRTGVGGRRDEGASGKNISSDLLKRRLGIIRGRTATH